MDPFVLKKTEKEVISIRIPTELLNQIDRKAAEAEISRNEFINQCIRFAFSRMDKSE